MSTREAFRQVFANVDRNYLRWFPGHMSKGMKQMQQQLREVDLVIEVHDARIPFSGRNPNFKNFTGVKPHILVLNKADLAPNEYQLEVESRMLQQRISSVLYTNCKDESDPGLKKLLPVMKDMVNDSIRYNRLFTADITVLICGVPNVGKSSLLNLLRAKGAFRRASAPVGAVAGVTRSVQNRVKVSSNPNIYVLDSPGILEPSCRSTEAALRLAACSSLQDHLVGEILIADYILFWLNKNENFRYVDVMRIDKPYDSVDHMLAKVAINNNLYRMIKDPKGTGAKIQIPCLDMAAKAFIKGFRTTAFGPVLLDSDYL